ncbi:MAG TPA: hypothetical protein VGN34_18885 [Ktedonobacteraceae bacterium]|jgi:hypothetical protein
MTEHNQNEGFSVSSNNPQPLARWLQDVLQASITSPSEENQHAASSLDLALLIQDGYHVRFYQQIPDFCMALLTNDPQASLHHASLLYHLIGCQECHQAYLDIYDSLHAAIYPQGVRPILGQGTRTLDGTPHRMLAHLCQTLISQAEALLFHARREHATSDEPARALLQLALQISSHIVQSTTRREALQDLVRVATLFDGPAAPQESGPQVYAYSPTLAGVGNMRSGMARLRQLAAGQAQESQMIQLRARNLDGMVVQHGKTLELHLHNLDPLLRGRFLCVNVALGSLFEPVRWLGGNPRSIKSASPVDGTGSLVTPLGETELRMSNPEERNLLEALFLLLQVRACDQDAG